MDEEILKTCILLLIIIIGGLYILISAIGYIKHILTYSARPDLPLLIISCLETGIICPYLIIKKWCGEDLIVASIMFALSLCATVYNIILVEGDISIVNGIVELAEKELDGVNEEDNNQDDNDDDNDDDDFYSDMF